MDIDHPINFVSQPQGSKICWSAALSMLFGGNRTMTSYKANWSAKNGLRPGLDNYRKLACEYKLRMTGPASMSLEGLTRMLQTGPIMAFEPAAAKINSTRAAIPGRLIPR